MRFGRLIAGVSFSSGSNSNAARYVEEVEYLF